MSSKKYDWVYYKSRFVRGNESYEDLARLPNAPTGSQLSGRGRSEGWVELRNIYQNEVALKTIEAAGEDEASISSRHMSMAQALQRKALEALEVLDPSELKASDLLAFIRDSAKMERDAAGIEEKIKTRIEIRGDFSDAERAERIATLLDRARERALR